MSFLNRFKTKRGIAGTVVTLVALAKARPWRIVEWGGDVDFIAKAFSWFWGLMDSGLVQLAVIVIGLLLIWWSPKKRSRSDGQQASGILNTIANQTHRNVTVDVDYRRFVNCKFIESTLRYHGGPYLFIGENIMEKCRVSVPNDSPLGRLWQLLKLTGLLHDEDGNGGVVVEP